MTHVPLRDVLRRLRCRPAAALDEPTPDPELLQRFVAHRDEAAFEELVRRHGPMILGLCRRVLGQAHDAEDAFQAVFLVLARRATSIRKQDALASWLHGVALRVARKARRAAERRRAAELRASPTTFADPLDEMSWRELRLVLDDELGRLPERHRAPLVLCYLEARTQDEAARTLGWSRTTFRRRLEEGRRRLADRLARRGVTLSAGLLAVLLSDQVAAGTPSLIGSALKACLSSSTPDGATSRAAALAEGIFPGTAPARWKSWLLLAVVLGVLTVGAGLADRREGPRHEPEAQARDRTGRDPQREGGVDRLGDPLPPGAVARLGTDRFRLGGQVYHLVCSPDGKSLFSCAGGREVLSDDDKAVLMWDARTGRQLRRFEGHEHLVMCLALAPDGKTLASGSADGTVRLWDVATGKQHRIAIRDTFPRTLAFSPDSRLLASGDSDTIVLHDVAAGKEVRRFEGRPGTILSLAFSPDGRTLASGNYDRSVTLWEVLTGRPRSQMKGSRALFMPDGKTLLVCDDYRISLREMVSGKERASCAGSLLAVSPDGNTLAVSGDRGYGAVLVSVETGKEFGRLRGREIIASAATFSADSKTLFTGTDRSIRLWEVATGRELQQGEPHPTGVGSVAAGGSMLATTCGDGVLRLWDSASGRLLRRIEEPGKAPPAQVVALSPDGKLLASGGWGEVVQLWDVATGKEVRSLPAPNHGVRALVFSPDRTLLAVGCQNTDIPLYDPATGKSAGSVKGSYYPLAFSSDGKRLMFGVEKSVQVVELSTRRTVAQVAKEGDLAYCGALSPAGNLLTIGYSSGTVLLCDAITGQELRRLDGPKRSVHSTAFSPDGRTVVAADAEVVWLWETATGKVRRRFRGHRSWLSSLAVTPDGRRVVSGSSDTTALVWDVTGRSPSGLLRPLDLTPAGLESRWADLASDDAGRAYQAVWDLAASPQALSFLRRKLQPAPPADAARVERLLAELDSARFAVRQRASRELEQLGESAGVALRRALEGKPSAEKRRRVEELLRRLEQKPTTSEALRALRAVEALEQIGTPEARRLLQTLAEGAADIRLAREARGSLQRLARTLSLP